MFIEDKIYDRAEINSSVATELIRSPAFQRLKKISQFGVPDEYYHHKNYSRFEHSIGVMLLLRRLGASEEEQITGLLHDVSHTAFSHVIDWVVGEGGDEGFQDNQHVKYLLQSELAAILTRHGFDPKRIAQYHHFPLLERAIPELCADRLDYSLRQMPTSLVKKVLKDLVVIKNNICFQSKAAARDYAINYLNLQLSHWAGFESMARYRLFADILKYGLDNQILEFADFWRTDDFVIHKLKLADKAFIKNGLEIMAIRPLPALPPKGAVVHKKLRFVDPIVVINKKLIHLSEIDADFAGRLAKARKSQQKGFRLPSLVN